MTLAVFKDDAGLILREEANPIEIVKLKGLEVSLLASGDGTEVVYHKLDKGSKWGLVPAEGWNALEFFHIITGQLRARFKNESILLKQGANGFARPIKEQVEFTAEEYTEFLYVSSQPTFHYYSKTISQMRDLAVSVEKKDGYTADHCSRITQLSMLVGEAMNLSPNELYILNLASFLHDVGKVAIPEEVLNKPGKLTDDEYEIIKTHTVEGRKLLEKTELPDLIEAGRIVEQHHERYDGKGYMKLSNKETDIRAAIITVVDSYDAMTTDRVYRKGMPQEEAFAELIRCKGTMFNPKIVDIFLSLKDKI